MKIKINSDPANDNVPECRVCGRDAGYCSCCGDPMTACGECQDQFGRLAYTGDPDKLLASAPDYFAYICVDHARSQGVAN